MLKKKPRSNDGEFITRSGRSVPFTPLAKVKVKYR